MPWAAKCHLHSGKSGSSDQTAEGVELPFLPVGGVERVELGEVVAGGGEAGAVRVLGGGDAGEQILRAAGRVGDALSREHEREKRE